MNNSNENIEKIDSKEGIKTKSENKIVKLLRFCVFTALLLLIFLLLTYCLRNVDKNTRRNLLAYESEKNNSVDMVIIGGSNVYRYWDAMRAYIDYGFTSYCYAVSDMDASCVFPSVKRALKSQNPKILVVEARPFLGGKMDKEVNASIRNVTDSWNVDIERAKAVKYISDINNFSWEDRASIYLDIIQYHDNYEALISSKHWKLADNRLHLPKDNNDYFKGFAIAAKYSVMENPEPGYTKDCVSMDETSCQIYKDILEYCKEENISVMVVSSPFIYKTEEMGQLNEMERIAKQYDVDFYNTNLHYDEMDIVFEEDFYNRNHVNIVGAIKYTKLFGNYLSEKYELPNHHEDEEYADWENVAKVYEGKEKEAIVKLQEKIQNGIEDQNE